MEIRNIFMLAKQDELLQYFTGTAVTFAATDKSLSATGIGDGLTAGEVFLVSGSSQSGNNVEQTIETVAADKITVIGAITDDTPGETIKLNQVVIGDWKDVSCMSKIVGSITSSGNCTVVIQQSMDGINVDHVTSISVTGGTSKEIDIPVYLPYARLKITNGDADQTIFRAYMCGRTCS